MGEAGVEKKWVTGTDVMEGKRKGSHLRSPPTFQLWLYNLHLYHTMMLSASLTYSHKHHNKKATANTKIQTVSNVSRTKC